MRAGVDRSAADTVADPWLTIAEVSERVRVPQETLRYWRHFGRGPRGTKFGKRLLYRLSDVRAWEDEAQKAGRAS
jgi:DNA-binding transcriptional MerR regulator